MERKINPEGIGQTRQWQADLPDRRKIGLIWNNLANLFTYVFDVPIDKYETKQWRGETVQILYLQNSIFDGRCGLVINVSASSCKGRCEYLFRDVAWYRLHRILVWRYDSENVNHNWLCRYFCPLLDTHVRSHLEQAVGFLIHGPSRLQSWHHQKQIPCIQFRLFLILKIFYSKTPLYIYKFLIDF